MSVQVAVPVPFLPLLTYSVPHGITPPVRGARVLVPLATRHVTGCVVRTDPDGPPDVALRPLIEVLDEGAFLPEHVIDLALWAAEYYVAGPGETVAAAMPPFAWVESERRVAITDAGRARLAVGEGDHGGAPLVVLRALATGRSFTPRQLSAAAGGARGTLDAVLRGLVREGLVTFARTMTGKASAFRTVRVVSLTMEGQEVAAHVTGPERDGPLHGVIAPLGEKQAAALASLQGSPDGLPMRLLKDRGIAAETVRRL